VQVRIFLLLSATRMRVVSGRCDTDEGCQWEIQTEEGWIPYWDSQV
jgi:hypothetical protein